MTPERYRQVKEIFAAAVEWDTGRRADLLERVCDGDEELRLEVESLLEHDKPAARFIEESVFEVTARRLAANDSQSLKEPRMGAYKILREIGRGGMGVVYFAVRDDEQFHKQVAIKLIKRGMDTDAVLQRFRNERQILAGLEHPNITRLIDGGTTADGVPYFVMEYVEGETLNSYCDSHKLSTDERLKLFRQICAAVHYAHQNLVIHRDIKPINILVTKDGVPKLLDFGIASVLSPNLQQETELTAAGLRVLTPEYASPEQIRGEKITTASDVFSLGVLLYELLTGHRPHRLDSRSPQEIARLICEEVPEKPSHAISRVEEVHGADGEIHLSITPETVSATRDGQPDKLRRRLSGDLDNIVLMAMRKEPARRYSSAAQLSDDIRRHLAGLPVIARKDTFAYRAAKFIKRNRVGVAAATLVLLAFLTGLTASIWQARIAARERDQARQEKAKAEEIKNFLERTLNYSNPNSNPSWVNGRETTVAEILGDAAKRLDNGEFSNQPEIKAELEQIIGAYYISQGKFHLADKPTQEFIALERQLYGEHHPKTLVASAYWAQLLFNRGEMAASENVYRQILPLMRDEQRKGNIKAENLADALNSFAYLRRTQGDPQEAEAAFRESLSLNSQIPKESQFANATTRSTLASTLADQGKFDEALQTSREAVAEYRRRGETDTIYFGFALTIFGGFLTDQGDLAGADASLREGETIFRKFLAPTNLWLGDNLRNQAILSYRREDYSNSLNKAREALKVYESFGPHYDNYPTALIIEGLSLAHTGQPAEGERILREAVMIRTDSLPKEHYWVALARSALGECLMIEKHYNEAEPLLRESYESLKTTQGASNPRTRLALQRIVTLYQSWRKPESANVYQNLL